MKKIMFNDRYSLTHLVLTGKKTMTRRLIPCDACNSVLPAMHYQGSKSYDDFAIKNHSRYKVGEVVAVAQSYKTLGYDPMFCPPGHEDSLGSEKGWSNKMYVDASLCKHHIKITDVRVERLQDIPDEEIMREGITHGIVSCVDTETGEEGDYCIIEVKKTGKTTCCINHLMYSNKRDAFKSLIDKVSGRGTWNSNPYVFAYSFTLID